ncbi:hypothetical protein TSH100_04170 [Azospirillum sp. TSH100]|uniref:hypothetical protein n=1 Tax=Azospirillum sp. TSH100 TaxID=652764 RepID=UPI000D620E31|nr:hypothetical protein [Azospirillum sp. TSH100]PWC89840.1 hypothetical protein TSH100_04170 [Azospirillum sp. TSH100]
MADLAEEEPDAAEMVADLLAEEGEAVDPLPWTRWAWRAWHALADDRQWRAGGMGPAMPGNIPWSVARIYAADHGLHFPTLFRLLRAMDAVHAEWWTDKVKAEQAKTETED